MGMIKKFALTITFTLVLISCAYYNEQRPIQERMVGFWEDLRIGPTRGNILKFDSNGSIYNKDEIVGTYQPIPSEQQVKISLNTDGIQIVTLTIAYDKSYKTDILIINPKDIPHESAMMGVFQKIAEGNK